MFSLIISTIYIFCYFFQYYIVKSKSGYGKRWTTEETTLLSLLVSHFMDLEKNVDWKWIRQFFKSRPDRGIPEKWQR